MPVIRQGISELIICESNLRPASWVKYILNLIVIGISFKSTVSVTYKYPFIIGIMKAALMAEPAYSCFNQQISYSNI